MHQQLVSIIMPCFNSERFLRESVSSVMAQTYGDWELLAVDDGSTDNTAKILGELAGKDPRVKLLHGEHRGSAAARNTALRCAQGRYIAFLDSDDVWKSNYIEKQLSFMKESGAGCICGGYAFLDEDSKEFLRPAMPKGSITLNDMLVTNRFCMSTGLYDTARCGKLYFNESLGSLRDDYAYWIEVVRACGGAAGNREVVAGFRVSAGSTTGHKLKLIPIQYKFYRQYLKLNPLIAHRNLFFWGIRGVWRYYIFRRRKRTDANGK